MSSFFPHLVANSVVSWKYRHRIWPLGDGENQASCIVAIEEEEEGHPIVSDLGTGAISHLIYLHIFLEKVRHISEILFLFCFIFHCFLGLTFLKNRPYS